MGAPGASAPVTLPPSPAARVPTAHRSWPSFSERGRDKVPTTLPGKSSGKRRDTTTRDHTVNAEVAGQDGTGVLARGRSCGSPGAELERRPRRRQPSGCGGAWRGRGGRPAARRGGGARTSRSAGQQGPRSPAAVPARAALGRRPAALLPAHACKPPRPPFETRRRQASRGRRSSSCIVARCRFRRRPINSAKLAFFPPNPAATLLFHADPWRGPRLQSPTPRGWERAQFWPPAVPNPAEGRGSVSVLGAAWMTLSPRIRALRVAPDSRCREPSPPPAPSRCPQAWLRLSLLLPSVPGPRREAQHPAAEAHTRTPFFSSSFQQTEKEFSVMPARCRPVARSLPCAELPAGPLSASACNSVAETAGGQPPPLPSPAQ